MSILDLKGVNKGYGEGTSRVEILKNIDLSVKEGEFVAILGFSGTGSPTPAPASSAARTSLSPDRNAASCSSPTR